MSRALERLFVVADESAEMLAQLSSYLGDVGWAHPLTEEEAARLLEFSAKATYHSAGLFMARCVVEPLIRYRPHRKRRR